MGQSSQGKHLPHDLCPRKSVPLAVKSVPTPKRLHTAASIAYCFCVTEALP
jgi:hypothetical protein